MDISTRPESEMTLKARPELSWGLAIATYNRADMLCQTVECALLQTRPPLEVVICDSSPQWESTKDRIEQIVQRSVHKVRLWYGHSSTAQQTVQRNCVLNHVTADILFMIDDDAFLRCDAAEQVMNIYESDPAEIIVAVGPGPMGMWKGCECIDNTISVQDKPTSLYKRVGSRLLGAWFFAHKLRGKAVQLKLPDPSTSQTLFIDGFRLTVRRNIAQRLRFDENFVSNRFEDADASYRFSLEGAVLNFYKPLIYHAAGISMRDERKGILSRFGWIINIAYLNRKVFGGGLYVRMFCWTHWLRNMAPDFLIGLFRRDFSRFRGCLYATGPLLRMTFAPQATIGQTVRRETTIFQDKMR